MSEQYCIFHINGGLGKNIAATAVAQCIKNNYPDRKLIVVCGWPDIFINLSFVDRVYGFNNTPYFYQTYIDGKESLIFHNEPYLTTDHINKKLPLIQSWCKMYNLQYTGEKPVLKFNATQRFFAEQYYKIDDSPIMVLHTNGGMMTDDARSFMWARDMPYNTAQEIVNKYRNDYLIYQCTKKQCPKLDGVRYIQLDENINLNTMQFLSILLISDKRILIDSSLQHAAAALNLPSTVLWNGTSPKVFGYDIHNNIETTKPHDFKLPNSYLFDFSFDGFDHEYPFGDDDFLFNMKTVFKSIDSL
jgi:hypothetical protein